MVIVHVAEYASGGVATYLINLIQSQLELDEVTAVYLLVSSDKTSLELLELNNPKLKIIRYKYQRSLSGIVELLNLSKIIKEIDPDVIHLHSSFAGLIRFKFIFSKQKKKTIYCAHGWGFNREISNFKKSILKFVEWILSFGCQKIINISNSERQSAKFISHRKMVTILNAIPDVKRADFLSLGSQKSIRLLFIGRLDKQKGVDMLIKAMQEPGVQRAIDLTIIGDSVLGQLIEKKGSSSIHFLGWLPSEEVNQEIEKADALIVPSRWEGFGLVALEGMRMGKTIVASDAGALPEIVVNGSTGILFKSNSELAIEEALKHLVKLSKKQILQMGNAGRLRFEKEFSYTSMVNEVMNLYHNLSNGSKTLC